MRRKKRTTKKRSQPSRLRIISILIVLFLSIPLTLYLMQNDKGIRQYAQQAVSPTFFCAGNCPAVSSDPFEVGTGQNVPGFTNSPDNNPKQINFQPCPKNTSVEDNATGTEDERHKKSGKNKSKHKHGSGKSSGGSSQGELQKLVEKIIELLKQLLGQQSGGGGGDQPAQPDTTTQPTQSDKPTEATSQAPEPSAPCPPTSTAPEPSASAGGSGGDSPSEAPPSEAPAEPTTAPAPPEQTVPPPPAANTAKWEAVAKCESGGKWDINTGNGYSGGLQFSPSTWSSNGGTAFAPEAYKATKEQQIQVAEKVLAKQGKKAWPTCGKDL